MLSAGMRRMWYQCAFFREAEMRLQIGIFSGYVILEKEEEHGSGFRSGVFLLHGGAVQIIARAENGAGDPWIQWRSRL